MSGRASKLWTQGGGNQVLVLAATCRAIALAFLLACGRLGTPYDTSVQLLDQATNVPNSFPGVIAWDAVFYQQIAQAGYEYEQYHAFFPLLPYLAKLLQHAGLTTQQPMLSFAAAGALISWVSFVTSAWLLHRLGQQVMPQRPDIAAAAVLFYCATPAAVFHTTAYTESLFGALTFLGLYLLYCRGTPLLASLVWALASAVRSNGIVNAGFVLHVCGQKAVQSALEGNVARAVHAVLEGVLCAVLVLLPFAGFQYYGYHQFCANPAYASEPRPWCMSSVPYLYGYVQKQYWGVGFLKYFQLSQIPNFALAAPVLCLAAWGVATFAAANRDTMLTLGFLELPLYQPSTLPGKEEAHKPSGTSRVTATCSSRGASRGGASSSGASKEAQHTATATWLPPEASVFVFHWAALALVAFLVMHVQVSTRFLSCCPALYWYMGHLWRAHKQRWLWVYCFAYGAVGSLLFANFLPWT